MTPSNFQEIQETDLWSDAALPEVTFKAVIHSSAQPSSQHKDTDEPSLECTLDVFQHNNDHSGVTLHLQMQSESSSLTDSVCISFFDGGIGVNGPCTPPPIMLTPYAWENSYNLPLSTI